MKEKKTFVCRNCSYPSVKPWGKCPDCGEWDSFIEEVARPASRFPDVAGVEEKPIPIADVRIEENPRTSSGIAEFDRVIGGGIVPGSATLVGGDPGIGKSTLLLQAACATASRGITVLYVTAEESALQMRLRAERLGAISERLYVLPESSLDAITRQITNLAPGILVIDSIQMVHKPEIPSPPGSVIQVRECATELIVLAKKLALPLFLIGHVTKEGVIAGPKLLEHIVDTVLYFEGDRFHSFRLLRAVKNRFGPTNEVAIFEMTRQGLAQVANPSAFFLANYKKTPSGSAVVPAMEGTRVLLIEIQALTSRINFGSPRRVATGVDYNRVSMILAVLEKRCGLHLATCDVFVNAVGGATVDEPAADLAIALAVAGAYRNMRLPARTVALGEIGLAGEVRPVTNLAGRLEAARKLGFENAIAPEEPGQNFTSDSSIGIKPVARVKDAIAILEESPHDAR